MKKVVISAILATIMISTNAQAQEQSAYDPTGFTVGGQVGLYGIGGHIKGKFTDTLGVKVGLDQFTYNDIEIEDKEVKYNFDINTKDILATLDWHPFANSFVVRGGVIVNDSKLVGDITPNTVENKIEFDFDGKHYVYKTEDLGAIETTVDFDPVAPYVGIGLDTSFMDDYGFGFTFDLGIIKQGAAKTAYKLKYGAALDIDKRIAEETASIPDGELKTAKINEIKAEVESRRSEIEGQIKEDLDKEMGSLQKELDKYEYQPFIAIGVNYKF